MDINDKSQSCRKTLDTLLQALFEVPRDEDRRVVSLPLINLSLGMEQTFIRHDTDTDPCRLSFVEKLVHKRGRMWRLGWESKHSEGCGNRGKEVMSGTVM